jgi:RNA polymerase sigma-70 factor (ECF subfamily)
MPRHATTSHLDGAEWIRSVLNEYERPLLHYCLRVVGEIESARDVVQDAFLRLIEQERSDVEDHVAEWLFRVCRNRCLDILRKERRMSQHDPADERPERAGDARNESRSASIARMIDLIDALPARQQELIRLRFMGGLSYREISTVTQLTVTNVGFLLHTAIKTLRATLAEPAAGVVNVEVREATP